MWSSTSFYLCVFHSGLLSSLLLFSVLANGSYGSPPAGRQMFSFPVLNALLLLFGGGAAVGRDGGGCTETSGIWALSGREGAASAQREGYTKIYRCEAFHQILNRAETKNDLYCTGNNEQLSRNTAPSHNESKNKKQKIENHLNKFWVWLFKFVGPKR